MRNLFLVLVIATGLMSCVTQERCNSKFPTTGKDSTYTKTDTIIKYDTILFPYESITLDTNGLFPENITFHSEKQKGGLKSTVDIKNGKLNVKCEADSLKAIIKRQNLVISTFNQKKETKWLPCDKLHRTTYDNFCRWCAPILLVFILVYLIIRALR